MKPGAFLLPTILGLFCLSGSLNPSSAVTPATPQRRQPAAHRLLVKYKAPEQTLVQAQARLSVEQAYGLRPLKHFPRSGVRLYETADDASRVLSRLRNDPSVLYAEPDYPAHIAAKVPNDPRFGEQWALNNTGQTSGTIDADIDAPEAWDVTTGGSSVVIAVLDTGVDYNHDDLRPNMWTNPGEIPGNGIDDDHNGYIDDVYGIDAIAGSGDPMDDHGHGTHCAGIIAAKGDNGLGLSGVCWTARIMALKFLAADGEGFYSDAIEGIEYALRKGAQIINASWGGDDSSTALYDAIKAARDAGVLFVTAAGNNGRNIDDLPFYPASFNLDNIIAVAATDSRDSLAGFSNYGTSTVDVAAPGVSILSTSRGNGYGFMSGTSMAAPHVSGLAALIKSMNPGFGWDRIRARILAGIELKSALSAKVTAGGRVNACRSLTATDGTPVFMAATPISLNFGAIAGGPRTGGQQLSITYTGDKPPAWNATRDSTWITCAPASGSGRGTVTANVDPSGLAAGSYSGYITVSAADAANAPRIKVNLVVYGAAATFPPLGAFEGPRDGMTGVAGAIPVTGWALDDVEVARVEIWREPAAGETAGLKYIGDAVLIDGARPDIELTYPGSPFNYRAGWGYMLLTNVLPNQGNGAFRIHAYAIDKEGNRVLLGIKTITCDNAHATKPFGTIDTPAQGGSAAGSSFVNFGWVLTPQSKTIPKDGSTISVYVDGVKVGDLATTPNVYNQYRTDVSTSFPGLNNTGAPGAGGPVGAYFLDTTKYPNGMHTIHWIATDDAGAAEGIGSRYFTVANTGAQMSGADTSALLLADSSVFSCHCEPLGVAISKIDSLHSLCILDSADGAYRIEIKEVEPLELDLLDWDRVYDSHQKVENVDATPVFYCGFLLVGAELRPLPVGSTLNPQTGRFSWMPGPGFIGEYRMMFIRTAGGQTVKRIMITVMLVRHREERSDVAIRLEETSRALRGISVAFGSVNGILRLAQDDPKGRLIEPGPA